MDAESKLIISRVVGKRSPAITYQFIRDLNFQAASGMAPNSRRTAGWGPYLKAVLSYFGGDADFAQLLKIMVVFQNQPSQPTPYLASSRKGSKSDKCVLEKNRKSEGGNCATLCSLQSLPPAQQVYE